MRPTTPPDDLTELLLYNQYSLAAGSALFGLLGEGFMLCVCVGMWGFWNMMHVKREPWGIQLLAVRPLLELCKRALTGQSITNCLLPWRPRGSKRLFSGWSSCVSTC